MSQISQFKLSILEKLFKALSNHKIRNMKLFFLKYIELKTYLPKFMDPISSGSKC